MMCGADVVPRADCCQCECRYNGTLAKQVLMSVVSEVILPISRPENGMLADRRTMQLHSTRR